MFTIEEYLALITNEHFDKQKFVDTVSLSVAPLVDIKNTLDLVQGKDFDLDDAVGVQLDIIGIWIGISRYVNVPLSGVYFSFDIAGLGFDQGVWKGPFDPDTGVVTLNDDSYRLLLRARIGANNWDGTMETTKPILDAIFNPDGSAQFVEVNAVDEQFAIGDGTTTTFQLKYQGQNVYSYTSADLFKTSWEGKQKLYPTPRTNLLLRSQEFDNAYWGKTRSSVTPNVAMAPDGTMTADKLVEDTSLNTNHQMSRSMGTIADTTYTWSVFFKSAERSFVQIQMGNFASQVAPFALSVNLTTGEYSATGTGLDRSAVVSAADGWWKVSVTNTSIPAAPGNLLPSIYICSAMGVPNYTGDGVSGIYVWGGQYSSDGVVGGTSYIPTVAATVTVTDYVAGVYGQFTLAAAPLNGDGLSWTGQGTAYSNGTYAFIRDNQDMTMTLSIAGTVPSALDLALITGGYINLKPTTVGVNYTIVTSVDGAPLFGFDADNGYIAGFDKGAWGTTL